MSEWRQNYKRVTITVQYDKPWQSGQHPKTFSAIITILEQNSSIDYLVAV